ncbi:MAG: hypothetical protein COA99_10800 [Moraxellaceae bacterium]|nr:MAG: hypothetical protein COA99_10800 [Moraxellaceae bacterium]
MGSYGYFQINIPVRYLLHLVCSCLFCICVNGIFAMPVFAHEMGEGAHVQVTAEDNKLSLQIEITLQELIAVFDIDTNNDGKVTEHEHADIDIDIDLVAEYVSKKLRMEVDKQYCDLSISAYEIVVHPSGDFIRYPITHTCDNVGSHLLVNYQLFFDQNPYHQGTLTVKQGQQSSLFYFWEDQREQTLDLNRDVSSSVLLKGVQWGAHHILIGLDHLLFLLCLILPSVLTLKRPASVSRTYDWSGATSLREVLFDVIKVVTAFTVAHTVTLTMSMMEWGWRPAGAVVEVAIAASIMLVALNNIVPIIYRSRWIVTLLLGLVHGYGFANGLMAYDLSTQDLAWTLLSFNLGVEFGQLLLIGVAVPVLYCLRNSSFYVKGVLKIGSSIIFLIAFVWLLERVSGISILVFSGVS